MDYAFIGFTALLASGLTLFSGFGLGTILTPAFALFFPLPTAIAMTAVVHLANNLFKIGLVGRDADWRIVLRFGVPAAIAAVAGAALLNGIAAMPVLARYACFEATCEITPVKATIGLVIAGFALLELSPAFARLAFPSRWLPIGGLLSGFFGGLSGNQGALRSAFLIKAGLTKQAYVGTGAACTVLVDVVRLAIYGFAFHAADWAGLREKTGRLVLVATLCAFLGAYVGKRLIHKVTLRSIELIVAVMLTVIGIGLMSGIL